MYEVNSLETVPKLFMKLVFSLTWIPLLSESLIEKSTKNQVLFLKKSYYSLKSVYRVNRQHFFLVKYNFKGQYMLQVRYVNVPFSHVCHVLHVIVVSYGYNSWDGNRELSIEVSPYVNYCFWWRMCGLVL